MTRFAALLRNERAAAAAEMALAAPLMVLLLAGLSEFGYYLYSEHRLVEGVRDAARYAARQPYSNFASCPTGATPTSIGSATTLFSNTRNVAKSGDPAGNADDRLWGWESSTSDTDFVITYDCFTDVGPSGSTTAVGGQWAFNPGGAPVVTVAASVPHASIFAAFGIEIPLVLNASQQAAVVGA